MRAHIVAQLFYNGIYKMSQSVQNTTGPNQKLAASKDMRGIWGGLRNKI